jgi:hypothetical protein
MHLTRSFLSKIKSESFLIGILHLIGLLFWYTDNDKKRGHPYVYPTTVMLGNLFLLEGLVDGTTASVDSSLLKARGPVWHKSSMRKNIFANLWN